MQHRKYVILYTGVIHPKRYLFILINFEKLSFGDKCIWLLNSESKDTLICMCDFLLESHCFGQLASHILTLVMSLILVFTIYMIFYAITLCFIMFICPFVGPLIWTNKILYLVYLSGPLIITHEPGLTPLSVGMISYINTVADVQHQLFDGSLHYV